MSVSWLPQTEPTRRFDQAGMNSSASRQREGQTPSQPVKFELTEQTREAIDNYLAAAKKKKPASSSSAAVAGGTDLLRRDSTLAWSANGLPALVWTRDSSGRIHCAEPKRPLSTAGLATCGQSSFYWDTRKLKVRCATWGLRSTTLSS